MTDIIAETDKLLKKLKEENEQLKKELDYWKKRALLLEKKYDEGEQMPSTRKIKTHLRPKRWKE